MALTMLLVTSRVAAEPDPGTLADANAGHAWIVPTALVPAAGTWSFEDVEVGIVGASYALTDRLVASGHLLFVPVGGTYVFGFAELKAQVVRVLRVRLAAIAGGYFNTQKDSGGYTSGGYVYGAGVATVCIDAACASHVDAVGGIGVGHDSQYATKTRPWGAGAAAVIELAPSWKAMLEGDVLFDTNSLTGQHQLELVIGSLRYSVAHGGVDFGWAQCLDCTSVPGVPVVQFSHRW